MAKSTLLLHPQFFHTLVPGFHTHLMIPVDFFSMYVEGKRSVEKTTAELKSDSSDITWRAKMTGRRLSDGWEEFAVANNFRTGDVVLVRYEGDLVFHVSDLGPNCCDVTFPSNKDQNNNNCDFLLKKHKHPRTDVGDDEEVPKKKKVKKKNSVDETEADSSSLDNSCFVANVTASNLCTDTLYLPQHFTSSNGITIKCRKIVLIDGGERSWALDLMLDETSDTFYISRGWRRFCEENGKKAGGFFTFKLVGNGETPVLSFSPTESIDNRRPRDCSEATGRVSLSTELSNKEADIEGERNEDECRILETEKKKRRVLSYASYSPCRKRFVTFTLPPDYDRIRRLTLPKPFVMENGINKGGEIYLLGKDGRKWPTSLLLDKTGQMRWRKGWKEFVKGNGLESGFTLKLIWEGTTPVFSLCSAESASDREEKEFSKAVEKQSIFKDPSKKDKIGKDENKKEERRSMERGKDHLRGRNSTASSQDQFLSFTITPYSVEKCILPLPRKFTRENGINKPRMITLLGKDGIKQQTKLLFSKGKKAALGNGWKSFVKANGLKIGDSFTLKLIWEETTPMLSLCHGECSIDRGESSETDQKNSLPIEPSSCEKLSKDENSKVENKETMSMEREKNHLRGRESTPSSQKQSVTLTMTPYSVKKCILRLPKAFTRENDINKHAMIILLGKDGIKHQTKLLWDKGTGIMTLGKGWMDFAKANGLKTGNSFTLKLTWEDTTPVLSLCHAECSMDRGSGGECSETDQKKSLPIEPSSCEKISKDENSKEKNNNEANKKEETMSMEREKNHLRGRDSTPSTQKQLMTLTITPSSYSKCKLTLPAQFARENSLNKPGMIDLLGKDGKKWMVNLVQDGDGRMNLGNDWKEFAKANDLKTGESFKMELISEDGTRMLKLVHSNPNSSKANEKESTEPRSRDSSSAIQNRTLTLTLTPEDVRACILHLPSQFMKANGINKLGEITILGENKVEWSAYLLSIRDGTVALENGWDEFCKANGVKLGESFTLEFVYELNTSIVLKFCSR
ncbi:B3 domain-containing protein REM13 [Eutrema salsugineum]|uniref:B3 domain-containing protein REM13 n=1 Tax=Eutrema salsugineum TaxID=72664 RepID=UPI000CED2662|nr:B3 domain-containing protein REM13 [Eutrema salsugineum]